MKKFWRSGMIDKKVIKEREQAEYINKLERTILELRRDDVGDLINDTTDYDEIRCGDNVILDFEDGCIVVGRKDSVKDIMHYESHSYNRKTTRENINDWLSEQMRNRSEYNTFKGED